jgi:hypothetical protein
MCTMSAVPSQLAVLPLRRRTAGGQSAKDGSGCLRVRHGGRPPDEGVDLPQNPADPPDFEAAADLLRQLVQQSASTSPGVARTDHRDRSRGAV